MLAVLPNGEAYLPRDLEAVVIEPGTGLASDMSERFDVWLRFRDGRARVVAAGIARSDAEVVAVQCASAINEALRARSGGLDDDDGHPIAVCVLGLEGSILPDLIQKVVVQCKKIQMRPIFITDCLDVAPFSWSGHPVEHVVDAEYYATLMPELNWGDYRLRQFELIRRCWRPSSVVSLGRRPAEECLAALRASK